VALLEDSLLPHVRAVSADSPLVMQALAWGMTDCEDARTAAAARGDEKPVLTFGAGIAFPCRHEDS
jgi:hypothetical protein